MEHGIQEPGGEVSVRVVRNTRSEESLAVHPGELGEEHLEDVAFMTAMTLVLLGNYAQSGHFGGPLAATVYTVAAHLGDPDAGALRYDLRRPKHPFADKLMIAGGHCIPACYALWMILYEALLRERASSGRAELGFDPAVAILPVDALGFRRSAGACATLLADHGLEGHPLFAQADLRGIRALAGHSETTDVTNDVNGGPSGIGVATAAGKALFWDLAGAGERPKILAVEGEFAMTEGHAQELKTAAIAQRVGKRLRVLLSMNNAGIDDTLIGGVVRPEYTGYDVGAQWAAYGWNVLAIDDGNDFRQVLAALRAMEEWPAEDRRPMILVAPTLKGWWPGAVDGAIPGFGPQLTSFPSHPYSLAMNSPYFVALAETFERRFGVEFTGIRDGKPATEADRLVELMTNVGVALSPLDERPGLRTFLTDRILETARTLEGPMALVMAADRDPFRDDRLRVESLPEGPVTVAAKDPHTGREVEREVRLFASPGESLGARRAISEVGKWLNHVTGGRFLTAAADLSSSINVEDCHFFGHFDPRENPGGTRLKAPIQEAANTATIAGALGQTISEDPEVHAGVWGLSGSYGAFTPLMYTPARVFSQQNQDSPFALGVLTVLAGHSGPETAADARTHFGIFAPQVWTLLPRGQVANLYLWDYNDAAPAYFAAAAEAARRRDLSILVIHVARPDTPVADRSSFSDPDLRAAAKGIYLIRDYDPGAPRMGTVFVQGASSTRNLVRILPRFEAEGLNVRVAAVISEDLFRSMPVKYRLRVLPHSERFNAMVVSTFTKRVPPVANLGPLTEEYSLYADSDDRWRTGGTEEDLIREAGLDPEAIFRAVRRFALARAERLARQLAALEAF
jgi:transketolase